MKNAAYWVAAASIVAWAGCGDYTGGKQTSASRNESPETPNIGSATDIAKGHDLPSNAANSADIGIGGPVQRESGNYQTQPTSAQISDEELTKQIKVALTTGSTGTTGAIPENMLTKIDVQVHNGKVTLSGPAATEEEKNSIGKQVAGFKGVRSVENNLTVGGSGRNQRPLKPLVPRGGGND
jgi:osmotically-inducible protein OsmY